ncbi:MAG: AAA family ATPase [Bacteroidota bacterium]|nr:AAA family ATPase [Bacteroidota bacterium]
MYIKRQIDSELTKWVKLQKRKPLLIRGARQIGKTESVRHLASQFENFVEVNFEENKTIHSIFEGNLSPTEICENLSVNFQVSIQEEKTLLFFDEIQACIPAIQSLRYFYEKIPELHVIAAGSLLEFALAETPSFGVGRIRSIFMYPLSFDEFLLANSQAGLLKMKQKASPNSPLNKALHEKLLKYFKKFIIFGGMPEITANYIETKDLNSSLQILDDLIFSFYDDFTKYKKRVPVSRIRAVFNSVVMQVGGKFVYSKVSNNENYRQIKEALELLIQAGLVIPVVHTSANGLPLGAEVNSKKQKMLLFDTGIFLRILGLNVGELLISNDFKVINNGNVAEMFAGLEILKYQSCYISTKLHYWHREARNSNAEVDYLFSKNNEIYPLEIKAGTRGSMQSMKLFLKSKNRKIGIRISSENFSEYENIQVCPLYAIDNIINGN